MTNKEAVKLSTEAFRKNGRRIDRFSAIGLYILSVLIVLGSFLARNMDGECDSVTANSLLGGGLLLVVMVKETVKAKGAMILLEKLDKEDFNK